LMRCSSHAEEYFTFKPGSAELELPAWLPRTHRTGAELKKNRKCYFRKDWAMSYLPSDPIEQGIIPWLKDVEAWDDENEKANGHMSKRKDIPRPIIPNTLAEKIHLYNAMLHLGVPKFIQAPLTEALVKEMYQKKLNECELELLEITIGRFHSHTVAVLDPVLNHFIGNYGSRHKEDDRDNVNLPFEENDGDNDNPPSEENDGDNDNPPNTQDRVNPLRYQLENPGRLDHPRDTVLIPPKLPVLGHSIKNWSGVRYRNGDARAAHVGYPLNVG
ncbi:hypothetical protein K505DRAFT_224273, partial [Melanomma pulvis-pyrius CBS 109.77]